MKRLLIAALCLISSAHSYAYDKPYIGEVRTINAAYDDTLSYLARDYNLGYLELLSANQNVDPWMPGEGTEITLPARHILPDAPRKGIVINLAEMRLYAYLDSDLAPVTYPLGIGREGLETPTGQTHIRYKMAGPTWRPTARMREEDPSLPAEVGPGYENPLGTHALYLGWPEYLIHGTNRPFGIGRRVSSGCIRMYPEAITKLFEIIDTGTAVNVIDQPIKAAWIDDTLYIEAHTNSKQSIEREDGNTIAPSPLTYDEIQYIERIAGDEAGTIDWDIINKIVLKRNGMPMPALTRKTDAKKAPQAEEPESKDTEKDILTTAQNANRLNINN
ncbi:MAG TPA: hypothetical protein DIU06_02825 [Rhodospirillaceae bacterium]|nr:hypothetical protein [Rhodospirillaceae bacterium]